MYIQNPDTTSSTPILRIIRQGEDIVPSMFVRKQIWNVFDTTDVQPLWKKEFILQYQASKNIPINENNLFLLPQQTDIFPLIMYFVAMLFFTISKVYAFKLFVATLQSVFSFQRFMFWFRQQPAGFRVLFLFLFPSSLLFLTMYLWQYTKYFIKPNHSDLLISGFILAAFIFFFLTRFVLMKTAAYIYGTHEATTMIHRNNIIFMSLYSFTGIVYLPLILFYDHTLWRTIPFVILVIETFRLFRSLQIARSYTKYSLFFFFLYLCTVEVMPVLFIGYTLIVLIN